MRSETKRGTSCQGQPVPEAPLKASQNNVYEWDDGIVAYSVKILRAVLRVCHLDRPGASRHFDSMLKERYHLQSAVFFSHSVST